MPTSTATLQHSDLKEMLQLGLGVVTDLWNYKTKNWVTGVFATDIDQDGDMEILACSRDGRVRALTTEGQCDWERIVGKKTGVGTIACIPPDEGKDSPVRIIAGTRDGKIYALDKDGKTISKDGKLYTFNRSGKAIDREQEVEAYWHDTGRVIRQVYADPAHNSDIIIGSEDGSAYALDYISHELRWEFPMGSLVRAVFACDIDRDGKVETLIGADDRHLYVLNDEGRCIAKKDLQYPILAIFAASGDGKGETEIVVATDDKELIALTPDLSEERWRSRFDNRLRSLQVVDVDNDGQNEIIAGSEDRHIYILDAHGKVLWRYDVGYRVFSVYAVDFDNDGRVELLVGSEDKVHAYRIRLIKDLDKRIRRSYQASVKPSPLAGEDLSPEERHLLQDILREEVKQRLALKQITLKHVEYLLETGAYEQALSELLYLEQQKVQLLWHKERIGHIRTLCFGHISNDSKKEIVVGTNEGVLQVFHPGGRSRWSLPLGEQILTIQTGYLDRSRWEDIVAYLFDHSIRIVDGTKRQEKRRVSLDGSIACLHITATNRQGPAEIIVGSGEQKLSIYGSDLQTPTTAITTSRDIKFVYAHPMTHPIKENDIPEIVVGSTAKFVSAYTRNGTSLWEYETWERVRTVHIKDIDGDDHAEVLIGSDDRNIHVLDSKGHLKWRYYLPDHVITIDTADIDHDSKIEVLVGCGDAYLYVFSREGDLLWKYPTNDRIRVVRAEDIDNDGNVEIALGTEDELELLQVVNQQQIRTLMQQCLLALQHGKALREVLEELLQNPDPALRAFALSKYAEQCNLAPKDFEALERLVRDSSIEVRKALIRAIMANYAAHPQRASHLLNLLSMDTDQEVRLAFVEYILMLMKNDWATGFEYLERFSNNNDRFVRRAVVRKLHQLVDTSLEKSEAEVRPRDEAIFNLLLMAAQDEQSEWIQQEAARTLAHFLNSHYGNLIIYMHLFISREIRPSVLRLIAHNTTTPLVQNFITAVIPLLEDGSDADVREIVEQLVKALEDMRSLKYGGDNRIIYNEFRHLFTIRTIYDIAHYQCALDLNQFTPTNALAPIILNIFHDLSSITRNLNIYLRRDNIHDRLSSLLDAQRTIDTTRRFIEREYSIKLRGEPITKMPDHHLFELLLQRWYEIVLTQLNELRGKADLKAHLQTKTARYEEQVGIWLAVSNGGRGSADNVKITLLHSSDFEVIGENSRETEVIFSRGETQVEFTIRPLTACIDLTFEIIYDDAEAHLKRLSFGDRLELQDSPAEFHYIPNPYSTGTPTHDSKMFYGREADIAFLKNNLTRTSAQTVIILYGQRRSGKTTLLFHLVNSPVLEGHIPVLIDMQRESYQITASKFLHNVASQIARTLKKHSIQVCSLAQEEFTSNPTFTFDVFLDDVEEKLGEQKLILLLDEFEVLEEQVAKGRLEPEIFHYLRSLMQHRPWINFLLSGTHQIEQLTTGYWSVFFNIARHYRLLRLSEQGAEDLIQRPVENFLEYDPFSLKKIRQLTADQPYLIHLMCRSLVDHCNEKRKSYVTINDVNIVLREVMQTGKFHFNWIWEQIVAEERIALAVIAEGGKEEGRLLSFAEIEEIYRHYRIPYNREQVEAALKSLIDHDVVESVCEESRDSASDSMRYRIPVGLIRRWLHQEKLLEQAIHSWHG